MDAYERDKKIQEASRELLDGNITKEDFDRTYKKAWEQYHKSLREEGPISKQS